jgi:hypothetical protein
MNGKYLLVIEAANENSNNNRQTLLMGEYEQFTNEN